MNKTSLKNTFHQLCLEAANCTICPRMKGSQSVLGHANGPINASILFVAEAPGRLGAGRTGVPFQGDRSSENFEMLLNSTPLNRKDVFITNAVLCNPLKFGKNSRPTITEIKNCNPYLLGILKLIKPKIVVTLGGVALDSINRILGTQYGLMKDAAHPKREKKFILLPLYHPSPRVVYTRRPLIQQKRDFKKILQCLEYDAS